MTPGELADPRQQLEHAITTYARHMDPLGEFDILADWVIVTQWSRLDGDNATYCVSTPSADHAPHRTIGLLSLALDIAPDHDHD